MRRLIRTCLSAAACALVLSGPAAGQTKPDRWDPETIDIAARIAVQDDGRVKPLSTIARFLLMRLSGGSSVRFKDATTGDKVKIKPAEFALECLFYPERAKTYPVFEVPRFEILDAIEVPHDGKKMRDWYSFNDLQEAIPRLFGLGRKYQKIDSKQRTGLQQQTLRLARSVAEFDRFVTYLDAVRKRYPAGDSEPLKKLFGGKPEATLAVVIDNAPAIADLYGKEANAADPHGAGHGSDNDSPVHSLVADLVNRGDWTNAIAMFPPAKSAEETAEWLTLGRLMEKSFRERTPELATQYAQIPRLQKLVEIRDDAGAFRTELAALQSDLKELAAARGQYEKVPIEVDYYDMALLHWAQGFFVISFLLAALLWFFPNSKVMGWLTWGSLVVPTVALVWAIVLRCIIRDRPPISTLYETILFITAVAVIVLMIVELINRQRIAVSLAALLGMGGMFLAYRYELSEMADTMPTLVAVLDTNFWLATHVTCIVTGYAASLLAAALAHVWLLGKAGLHLYGKFTGKKPEAGALFRNVGRMIYGTVCFGLLFSIVGTILGGVWANDSWGRFWGWDPKENGALMICLWQLAILHARLGGYIRHFGLAAMGVVLGMITAFSWWHVNQLGVGLHSYGFTDGVMRNLWIYYSIEIGILGGAGFTAFMGWQLRKAAAAGAAAAKTGSDAEGAPAGSAG